MLLLLLLSVLESGDVSYVNCVVSVLTLACFCGVLWLCLPGAACAAMMYFVVTCSAAQVGKDTMLYTFHPSDKALLIRALGTCQTHLNPHSVGAVAEKSRVLCGGRLVSSNCQEGRAAAKQGRA